MKMLGRRNGQHNQGDSSHGEAKKDQKQTNVRLSIQAVFFLGDGDRLVENCILENVALNKKKTKSGPNSPETNLFLTKKAKLRDNSHR